MADIKHGLDLNGGDAIYWFDRRRGHPKRTHTNDQGEVVTEKLPQGAHRMVLKPDGDIVALMLVESAATPTSSAYAARRIRQKLRKGWIPADECPIAARRMPRGLMKPGDEPCPDSLDDNGMVRRLRKPCAHLKVIMDKRRQTRADRDAQWEKAFESQVERMANAQENAMGEIAKNQAVLTDALKQLLTQVQPAPAPGSTATPSKSGK